MSVIAINSDPTNQNTVSRKHKDGSTHIYPCPSAITLYITYMGGVDHSDQLRGYYHVCLKCRKYYTYIFWFLFDLMVTNTYILTRHYSDLPFTTLKDFRIALAKELVGDYVFRKKRGRRSVSSSSQRFCLHHFPERGAEKGHRCHFCYKYKKQRHESVWHCSQCNLFFCHNGKSDDCFRQYHLKYGPSM